MANFFLNFFFFQTDQEMSTEEEEEVIERERDSMVFIILHKSKKI